MEEKRAALLRQCLNGLERGEKAALDTYLGVQRKTRLELFRKADPTSMDLVKLSHFFKIDVFDILIAAPLEDIPTCIRMFNLDYESEGEELDYFMPLFDLGEGPGDSRVGINKAYIGNLRYRDLLHKQSNIKQMPDYQFQGELLHYFVCKDSRFKKRFIERAGIGSYRFDTLCLNGNLRCSELLAFSDLLDCFPVFLLTPPRQYSVKLRSLAFVLTRLSDSRIQMITGLYDDMRYKGTSYDGMAYPVALGVKNVLLAYKELNYG